MRDAIGRSRIGLAFCFAGAMACGGGGTTTDGGADVASADVPGGSDTTTPTDTPVGTDTPNPTDTPTPTDTGSTAMCTIAPVASPCGAAASIRVTARLGAGMAPAMGNLVVNIAHLRLGMSTSGGVPHTGGTRAGVTVSPTASAETAFDFCAGGEMWSEGNCEYNLWGFIDRNANRMLDAGEPAGRAVVTVSCFATASPCFELVLDCVNGASCANFSPPSGACRCASPACPVRAGSSPINTCS